MSENHRQDDDEHRIDIRGGTQLAHELDQLDVRGQGRDVELDLAYVLARLAAAAQEAQLAVVGVA